ncbi:hypothetical protein ACWEJ6_53650 [Nonomuraea sp. NPDC004702]
MTTTRQPAAPESSGRTCSALNPQEAWWRIFRRHAIAGQCFVGPDDIDYATRIATTQLNALAKPWVWGRPPPPPRQLRRRFAYTL